MSKKIVVTLWFVILATAFALHAQNARDVRYDNVQVVRRGERVEVSFKAFVGSECIGRKGQFLFTPVLYNDTQAVVLPTFCVYSRHADWMEFREELSKKQAVVNEQQQAVGYHCGNNGRISYRAAVAWQPGLTNVGLRVEPVLQSSRKKCYDFPGIRITEKLFLTEATEAPALVEAQRPDGVAAGSIAGSRVHSLADSPVDSLARQYSFIVRLSPRADGGESLAAANERGALRIDFGRSSSVIERYYRGNDTALTTLATVIRQIERSGTARVARITITGFSGIDGTLEWNDRLAWERADAVREFIVENTGVSFSQIHLYNGSEDWSTLRRLVEQCAEMESRYDVLRIIDHVPILKGREKQLMDLAGGMPYRYMKRYLFPKLRNAAEVRVSLSPALSEERGLSYSGN